MPNPTVFSPILLRSAYCSLLFSLAIFSSSVQCRFYEGASSRRIPAFLYRRQMAPGNLKRIIPLQQQQQQIPIPPSTAVIVEELPNTKAVRPFCYFSPVQCLLRTPGQQEVFTNHPRFNESPHRQDQSADEDHHRQRLEAQVAELLADAAVRAQTQIMQSPQTQTSQKTEVKFIPSDAAPKPVKASYHPAGISGPWKFGSPWKFGL